MVQLTLIFATFNGADTLPRMLDALERLEAPPGGFKIIAVDNGSTDGSADIIREHAARLPLTLLQEPRRGKSMALNTALAEIEGDLVVLTDDDIIPPSDWLTRYRLLAERHPGHDVFGGAIHPVWDQEPPDWVLRCVPRWFYGWTGYSEGPIGPREVWGGNMMVRASLFRDHAYHEGIGPDGTRDYASGEDVEFTMRLVRAGHLCWHSLDVAVGHIVNASQLEPDWILRRASLHARGDHQLKMREGLNESTISPSGLQSTKELADAIWRVARSFVSGDFDARLLSRMRLREILAVRQEIKAERVRRFAIGRGERGSRRG